MLRFVSCTLFLKVVLHIPEVELWQVLAAVLRGHWFGLFDWELPEVSWGRVGLFLSLLLLVLKVEPFRSENGWWCLIFF
jgi:hypothetical protein